MTQSCLLCFLHCAVCTPISIKFNILMHYVLCRIVSFILIPNKLVFEIHFFGPLRSMMWIISNWWNNNLVIWVKTTKKVCKVLHASLGIMCIFEMTEKVFSNSTFDRKIRAKNKPRVYSKCTALTKRYYCCTCEKWLKMSKKVGYRNHLHKLSTTQTNQILKWYQLSHSRHICTITTS